MCRAGGPRCPGQRPGRGRRSVPAGSGGDDTQRESYQGTRWQGYDEAAQRGEEIHRRVYDGETVEDIMSDAIVRRAQERIAQIAQEGW
jgi:hypothetical protein